MGTHVASDALWIQAPCSLFAVGAVPAPVDNVRAYLSLRTTCGRLFLHKDATKVSALVVCVSADLR